MTYSIASIVLISITAFQALSGHVHVSAKSEPLCSDASGIYLGLAIDEDSYETFAGKEYIAPAPTEKTPPWAPKSSPPQQWKLTDEQNDAGPQKSFGGKYLQVSPDTGRTYPDPTSHHHCHLKIITDIEEESPYISFQLRVPKGGQGIHTLFVRWTGGDDIGGGDSFYVVMKHKGEIVSGQRTIKPSVVPVDSDKMPFAGCCYQHSTHACPCFHTKPDEATCAEHDWLDKEHAAEHDKECLVGEGMMDIIKAPKWYLFSGQEDGNVMDFEEEPWDATCEANGSNTADSGHDFPSWYLEKGDYELRIYAREDGTAVDGIYVAGPDANAPGITHKYSTGDSTICPRTPLFKTIGMSLGIGLGVVGLVAFLMISETGQEVMHQGKLLISRVRSGNLARDSMQEYEQMGQLETNVNYPVRDDGYIQ